MVVRGIPLVAIADDVVPQYEEPIIVKHIGDLPIEEQIDYYAQVDGIDPVIMRKIAYAESRYQNVPNYLYDGENGHYTAYGIFQITRTTYRGFCGDPSERLIVSKNIQCAMKIAKESGLHHWNESRSVWEN